MAPRKQVQDLGKYRSKAQDKYNAAMERLIRNREEYASREDIQNGDLVMGEVLSHKSKIHPKHDGPFVAIASANKDVYQLSTSDGYVLQNLVNSDRLRKLSLPEIKQYTNEFWRLKLYDRRTQETQGPASVVSPPMANSRKSLGQRHTPTRYEA